MKFKYPLAAVLCAFYLVGCASTQLKNGHKALEQNDCYNAYGYFKKAPENFKKNESLARGLEKSTICLAGQRLKEAEFLYKKTIRLKGREDWSAAHTDLNEALNEINKTLGLYNEALLYSEYYKGSLKEWILTKVVEIRSRYNHYSNDKKIIYDNILNGKGIKALDQKDYNLARSFFMQIEDTSLNKRLLNLLDKRECEDLRYTAKLSSEKQLYADAINNYEKAINLVAPGENKLISEIQADLISVICQSVQYYINRNEWLKAQSTLDKLDLYADLGICSEQIKSAYDKYRIAHSNFLLSQSLTLIKHGKFYEAFTKLNLSTNEGNESAKKTLEKLRQFENKAEEAVKYATTKYENLLTQNKDHISPEVVCRIKRISIKEFNNKTRNKEINKFLSKHDLGFKSFNTMLVNTLKPHYSIINENPDSFLYGSFEISIVDKSRWLIVMDMKFTSRKNILLFYKRDNLLTGKFDIFTGWVIKSIDDNQSKIIETSLNSLSKKIANPFLPFGRCKKNVIKEIALKRLNSVIDGILPLDDFQILSIMVTNKIQ